MRMCIHVACYGMVWCAILSLIPINLIWNYFVLLRYRVITQSVVIAGVLVIALDGLFSQLWLKRR